MRWNLNINPVWWRSNTSVSWCFWFSYYFSNFILSVYTINLSCWAFCFSSEWCRFICVWVNLITGQLVLLEHVSAGNIRSVELRSCMHVFLFHLSWRQQFWNILGILFILFYFGLKVWKGLKTILKSKRDEWWKYAKTSLVIVSILSGDYFRQKIDVCLHVFDILLSALGVTWCWGIIGWFWIPSSYNSRLRWMWLLLTLSTYHHHHHNHHFSPSSPMAHFSVV